MYVAQDSELQPSRGLQVFALDEGAVLYAAPDQELHALNSAAAFLWMALEAGTSADALADALSQRWTLDPLEARRWVGDQLADWRQRGWIEPASGPRHAAPSPREGRSRRLLRESQPTAARARLRAEHVHHYRLLTTRFALGIPSGPVAARIRLVLAHLECGNEGPADVVFELEDRDGRFDLIEDGRRTYRGVVAAALAPILKLQMRNVAMNRHDYFMQLHAGAVLGNEGALLFPGVSGSGKSTLTAALVAAGYGYLSDEVALLERDSLGVRPFPLALTVKPGAVGPLSDLYPSLRCLDVHHREDGKRVRYLRPPASAIAPDSEGGHPVRALIFPRHAPEARPSLRPIGRCEALQRLLDSCLSMPDWLSAQSVANLVHWMRGLESFELTTRTVPEAVAMVQQQLKPA